MKEPMIIEHRSADKIKIEKLEAVIKDFKRFCANNGQLWVLGALEKIEKIHGTGARSILPKRKNGKWVVD